MELTHLLAGNRHRIVLGGILLFGFILRFWNLDYQSLWYDELYTMHFAHPDTPLSHFFTNIGNEDEHPPLYYLVARCTLYFFGYSSFVIRLLSVVIGTLGIWAIYNLGKELKNREVGWIAGLFTAVNYFHIYYSQDARSYGLMYLLSTWSFLYFIRLYKKPSIHHAISFTLLSISMCYTHYFGVFICFSQLLLSMMIFFADKEKSKYVFLKTLALCWVVTLFTYLPWISYALRVLNYKDYWPYALEPTFFLRYFKFYFGDFNAHVIVNYVIVAGFIFLSFKTFSKWFKKEIDFRNGPFQQLLLMVWIGLTLFIPVVYSVVFFPIMWPRYSIIILPGIFLLIAYTLEALLKNKFKLIYPIFLVFVPTLYLIFYLNYYSKKTKQDYREIQSQISQSSESNAPIFSEEKCTILDFYFNPKKENTDCLQISPIMLKDSVMQKRALTSFWYIHRNNNDSILSSTSQIFEPEYTLFDTKTAFDCAAQLFQKKEDNYGRETQ